MKGAHPPELSVVTLDDCAVSSTVVPLLTPVPIAAIFVPAACVAVSAIVGGVKFPEYTANPRTIRMLLRLPLKFVPLAHGLLPL